MGGVSPWVWMDRLSPELRGHLAPLLGHRDPGRGERSAPKCPPLRQPRPPPVASDAAPPAQLGRVLFCRECPLGVRRLRLILAGSGGAVLLWSGLGAAGSPCPLNRHRPGVFQVRTDPVPCSVPRVPPPQQASGDGTLSEPLCTFTYRVLYPRRFSVVWYTCLDFKTILCYTSSPSLETEAWQSEGTRELMANRCH